jgi:Outer membrane protein and related peptidoglycan-associated (lipo)proteins
MFRFGRQVSVAVGALVMAAGLMAAPAPAAAGPVEGLRVLFYLPDSVEMAGSSQRDMQLALAEYRRNPGARIELVGHSNCFEDQPMALSEQRTNIVADALVSMGVDRNAISMRWVGGAEAGPGNALNQRVDIKFSPAS